MVRWLIVPASLCLVAALSINTDAQKNKGDAIHDPANAVANLDVHPELQATLFVSEPKITNPTNLDIDHRGRIWLCDVVNYRGNNGKRPEGDRILILEDTDGDGVCDKVTTFYQGRDVDSAMGICVLGNKVIVSCSPNVWVFTKDDDDKIIKKEVLFTKTGIPQHDHSAHSFVFGPDGRLYWNFGNTGGAVHDKNGKPVVDLAGNVVRDGGQPYRQGMVFRCDMDGSNFEVLGNNFRNNYEVTVDSFGTLWQSDNDDDGNRGVRINYVMEYGNFGYVDEFTGAGWQTKRTNIETEIPLRHWHLNDPGVVPNLLQTGGGSPTGICIYEGRLLPGMFQNQVIHCDAGPSIVRAYPVTVDGAGYKAKIVNVLDGSKKNQWFRPADVCVAPDGSVFVTDWYDPGVGGHAQRDSDRGRIFRVAPPKTKYVLPKYDLASADADKHLEALKSPNLATRYLAWTHLHKMKENGENLLLKLYKSPNSHERARALWLLGRIEGKGQHYVDLATSDGDPSIRVVGIRLARQLKLDLLPILDKMGFNELPIVKREMAIALRSLKTPEAAALWAKLAKTHNGEDRWYLEALGIGAANNWDACLEAYLKDGPSTPWLAKGTRDIIWRSRAAQTPELLRLSIQLSVTPLDELPRLFRAFDFQKDSNAKNESLVQLAFGDYADPARRALITGEAIARIKNVDVKNNPKHASALGSLLDRSKGTPQFVELVGKFGVSERFADLLTIAQRQPSEQIGVDAIRILLDRGQVKLIKASLESSDRITAANTAQAIAGAGHDKANDLLLPIITNDKQDLELRRQATRALAKNKSGAQELIKLALTKQLAKDLEVSAGSALSSATWKDIKTQADKLFPQPTTKDKRPLPAITELVKSRGNVGNGQAVFAKQGTCANCHTINGQGKNVGPDLSEIGKKLSREAVLESILYPSASILHNYEMYVVETKAGTTAQGLLVSRTPAEIAIKGVDSIVRTFKTDDVESITKSPISLMPADLHQSMSTQELVDVVEYLLTLREASKK